MLAVENHLMIVEEMRLSYDDVYFWSDSMVVLGWIKNDDAKLPKYIDRRVTSIREASGADQWRQVLTDVNPADTATRGSINVTKWLRATAFLYSNHDWQCLHTSRFAVDSNPPKRTSAGQAASEVGTVGSTHQRFSFGRYTSCSTREYHGCHREADQLSF